MSSMGNKELGIAASIAVTSFVAGNLVAKWMQPKPPKKVEDEAPAIDDATKSNLKEARFADAYIREHSLREPSVLKELREHTTANVPLAIMLTDPCESQFFRLLLNMLDAKKCMEVGTYTGYNALSCALTIPSDGIVYALDINESYVKEGYPFFEKAGVKDKIITKIAPALDTMDELISNGDDETFDFIYVDADKPGYSKYLDRAMVLLRSGGILALDNTLQGGRVTDVSAPMTDSRRSDATAMHELNKKLRLDNRFQLSFLNIADGVTLCRKL